MAAERLTWGGEPLTYGGEALFWGHPDDEPHGGGRPKKRGGWGKAPSIRPRPSHLFHDDEDALVALL